MLAVSFALLSIWALQQRRRGRFALGAVLTLAASPLAFLLLVIALGGAALSRRTVRDLGVPVVVVAACCAAEVLLYRLFGDGGHFPFRTLQLVPAIIFSVLGLWVTRGVPAARPLLGIFALYFVVLLVAYVVPSSVGSNIERIRYLAVPLALIALALRRWRPLWLAVPVLALAGIWNATPIVASFARVSNDPEASVAYWQPAIGYLHTHLSPSYRVEVVDTVEHWPAAYFPDAGIPLVRGWYRQSDFPQNELLYDGRIAAATYERWLRRMGVRYVVLSDAPADYSARAEAALIRSGRTSLVPVDRTAHLTVYELPHASPLIVGPASATVMWLWPSRLVAQLDAPGTYEVKLRWSPYWHASQGCVSRTPDGLVRLTVANAGLTELGFGVSVHRGLQALAGVTPHERCAR
jgi:hypothetical protein